MNLPAKAQEVMPAHTAPQPSMFELIMRAVQDPACDPVKMAQLLELSRQVRADDAKEAYTRAMILMKPKLPIIDRKGRIVIHEKGKERIDANIIQSTDYAKWEDIDEAITPILGAHGFVLTFRTGNLPDGRVSVTAILSHEMGHSEESEMALPLDTSGSKNNVQAAGSSTSYGKRFTATALLNIRTKGQDDDGKKGGDPGTVTDEQAERILDLLTKDKADVPGFCKYMGVASIIELPASQYNRAIEVINTRSQKVKAKQP